MQKSVSQKIARAFEIAGYILMLPALGGVFLATLFINNSFLFPVVIYLVFIAGVVLLIGYFKHSRGRLGERLIPALWLSTTIYNGLLLLPVLTLFLLYLQSFNAEYTSSRELATTVVGYLFPVIGYTGAVVLSVKAFLSQKNQKYR